MFAVMCDFSSMTDAVEWVDSGSGSKQTISLLKDSSSMTAPITSHSRHIQTERIKMKYKFLFLAAKLYLLLFIEIIF